MSALTWDDIEHMDKDELRDLAIGLSAEAGKLRARIERALAHEVALPAGDRIELAKILRGER